MGKSIRTSESRLLELKTLIEQQLQQPHDYTAFVAFDGFIDTVQKAVHKTVDDQIIYFNTIRDFADHLQQMDGKSGQVELVTTQIKMGGNGPILSAALGQLGVKTTCLGALGFPDVAPVFKDSLTQSVSTITAAEPGKSNAIEFDNGKIILSDLSTFKQYDWNYIKEHADLSVLRKTIQSSKLIALVDWANLRNATQLWKGLLDDLIKPDRKKNRLFLFDLCDPSKKSVNEIKEMLDLVGSYSTYGSVTLGLNENEANKIWMALQGNYRVSNDKIEMPDLKTVGYGIYRAMDIDTLLIHPLDRTLVFKNQKEQGKQSVIELKGFVITEPEIQTGAGDNLNAGYCLGLMAGFEVEYCMLLGMAVAGAYVKTGSTPDIKTILHHIDEWIASLKVNAEYSSVEA